MLIIFVYGTVVFICVCSIARTGCLIGPNGPNAPNPCALRFSSSSSLSLSLFLSLIIVFFFFLSTKEAETSRDLPFNAILFYSQGIILCGFCLGSVSITLDITVGIRVYGFWDHFV